MFFNLNYYLCFDAGTQSVKVAVYDENGKQVAVNVNPTSLQYPKPGWVEMNVHEYFELVLRGAKRCVEIMREKNLDISSIRSVMGDGIICGIAGINADGRAVTPFINYLDSRTQEDADELAKLNLDIWAEETGNPEPLCLFPAMHARWLIKNSPNIKEIKKNSHSPYVVSNGDSFVSVRSYQETFNLLLKRLKIKHRGFHSLRHTFATRALECGMDVKSLSEILGHKSTTVTLNRYVHSMFDHKKDMMNRLGKLL